MALAQITIRDEEDGRVDVRVEFEPALQNDDEVEHPLSALIALRMVEAVAAPEELDAATFSE